MRDRQRRTRGGTQHPVPRPKPPEETLQLNTRLPMSLVERLDALVEEHRANHPYRTFTRSDLMRELLAEGVERREASKKKAKP